MSAGGGNVPKKSHEPVPISLRSSTLQSLLRASAGAAKKGNDLHKTVDLVASLAKPALAKAVPKAATTRILPKSAPKAAIKFTPTLEKVSPVTPKARGADSGVSANGITAQSLLAHRLALQGQSSVAANRQRQGGGFKVTVTANKNLIAQANPRSRNKLRVKKTRDILELSFPPPDGADDVTQYRPISLPYFLPEDQIDQVPGVVKSQRPTIKAVDEANANAAALFERTDEEIDWFLVQFPVMLPSLDKEAMNKQLEEAEERLLSDQERAEKARKKAHERSRSSLLPTAPALSKADIYHHTPFSALPEGYLGKLEIRKSGRAVLRLGNHVYDVNSGSDCKFYQQVGIHIVNNNEFFFMGQCFKRMMVTPNIQSMIKSDASRANVA